MTQPINGVLVDRSKDAGHFEWQKNMILSGGSDDAHVVSAA